MIKPATATLRYATLALAILWLVVSSLAFASVCTAAEPATDAQSEQAAVSRKTAPPIKQAPVDFNHPPREYVEESLHGWTLLIEKQLIEEDPRLADKARRRLSQKLAETVKRLPPDSLADLRRVKLFLMFGPRAREGGRASGLQYFSAKSAASNPWLDPRMDSSIAIFDANNYVQLSDLWALKALLHEFGHAQHLEHWAEDRLDIYDTWARALEAGLYQTVHDDDRDSHFPNYAAQNHLEYFAELTTMYFAEANYFPRDREGLRTYDPAGFALIERLWGVGPAEEDTDDLD